MVVYAVRRVVAFDLDVVARLEAVDCDRALVLPNVRPARLVDVAWDEQCATDKISGRARLAVVAWDKECTVDEMSGPVD